jgi:hypothetical protein
MEVQPEYLPYNVSEFMGDKSFIAPETLKVNKSPASVSGVQIGKSGLSSGSRTLIWM